MFHIGHLNLLNNAKEMCDILIVGVNSDKLVEKYKNNLPVISENERRMIVENIKAVDTAFIAMTLDKVVQYKQYKFDALFIGDDWKGNKRWIETGEMLKVFNVDIVYLPYTNGISSTLLRIDKNNRIRDRHD